MTILGKIIYASAKLLATFAKLSIHVIFYTVFLIVSLDPTRSERQIFLFVPQILVFVAQLLIMYKNDWYTASEAGYCLNLNSAYIWPTSANRAIGNPRPLGLWVRWRGKTFRFEDLHAKITNSTSKFKIIPLIPASLILPFYTMGRLSRYPASYGFLPSSTSRTQYQARFSATIGKQNFGNLLCSPIDDTGLNALLLVVQLAFSSVFCIRSQVILSRYDRGV